MSFPLLGSVNICDMHIHRSYVDLNGNNFGELVEDRMHYYTLHNQGSPYLNLHDITSINYEAIIQERCSRYAINMIRIPQRV